MIGSGDEGVPSAAQLSSTLSASIVAVLKDRIIAWKYLPEQRLTEDGVCREFGVSRSPARDALRVLEANGFVRRMGNRGYAVQQVNLKEINEIYETRLALELYVVETLAQRGGFSDVLRSLTETWSPVQSESGRTAQEWATLDAKFHETLAGLLGNDLLSKQLHAVDERLLVFRMIDFESADRVKTTCDQHLAIINRIGAGDVTGARSALRRHIEEACNIVGKSIKEALARAYVKGKSSPSDSLPSKRASSRFRSSQARA